jgi:hypothetical protein
MGAGYLLLGAPTADGIGVLSRNDAYSTALGLNDLNTIVGDSGHKGFIFQKSAAVGGNMIYDANSFDVLGFHPDSITQLTDINNSNTFVGVGLVNGVEHGLVGEFVAVPEPSAIALAIIDLMFATSCSVRIHYTSNAIVLKYRN